MNIERKLKEVLVRIDLGIATEEEKVWAQQEQAIIAYRKKKLARPKMKPGPKPKDVVPLGRPRTTKTADRKQYAEEYRIEHRVELAEKKKLYNQTHKEQISKYQRERRQRKKEEAANGHV